MSFFALVLCVAFVALLVLGGAAFFLMRGSKVDPNAPPAFGQHTGPPVPGTMPARARDVIFFVRVEGRDDEQYAQEMASRHGQLGGAAQMREAALDLVRLAPTATHVWAGPADRAPAGPGLAHSGLHGGLVLGFLVRGTRPLYTVQDDRDLGAFVATLRRVAAWTDRDFAGGAMLLAQARIDAQAPALVAVRKETRPGHQICRYCDEAFLAHDSSCPNCGGVVNT